MRLSTVVVPEDRRDWPTLGPQIIAVMAETLVHGPGDLRGEPARLDNEFRAFVYRAYEVYPRCDHDERSHDRGDGWCHRCACPGEWAHAQAGRRRFKRVGLSYRKGLAKTEKAAWIAAMELFAEAPVRTDGWRRTGSTWEPVGAPVNDPYIPMLAYTEEQSEELAYGALYAIIAEGPLASYFDVGLQRIMRLDGRGKAVPLANSPSARDGARTTFQHFDETHHFTSERLKRAHNTMLGNIPKRKIADAWSLETTTAPAPGAGSVAEDTMDYATDVRLGKIKDAQLFFMHREADDELVKPLELDNPTLDQVRAVVLDATPVEARGWSDVESIARLYLDPTIDKVWWLRTYANKLRRAKGQAFDFSAWRARSDPAHVVPKGALITLGFDGSRTSDSTALVACEVDTGFIWPIHIWSKPAEADDWEVPELEVHAAVAEAFSDYNVWRMNGDPPHWDSEMAQWAGIYGKERVIAWHTWRNRPMAAACLSFNDAIMVEYQREDGSTGQGMVLTHSGDPELAEHVGNAQRRYIGERDDKDQPLWVIQKDRRDSEHKIDGCVAAILAWMARLAAVADGVLVDEGPSVYEERGIITVRNPFTPPGDNGLIFG
jgi:phage terminase large subunit-like protein